MGRRLNIPIPTVIDTELVPLDEMFSIDNDSTLEQWYYDNNSKYAPNRKFTPLILTPKISVYDKDSERSWSSDTSTGVDKLSIYLVEWYVKEYDATAQDYVERKITTGDASGDYVIHEQQLYVRKNVSYSHAVTIRCVVTYIDPRDPGLTYSVEDKLMLTTNRDSTVVFPEVAIISPSTRTYNPLIDDTNSQYTFDGAVINNPETQEVTELRKYTANVYGTEEVLPSTEEDPTSCAPIMDIRYGAGEVRQNEEFMYRQTADGDFPVMENNAYIDAVYGNTVKWHQFANTSPVAYLPKNVSISYNGNKAIVTSNYSGSSGDTIMIDYKLPFGSNDKVGHIFIIFATFNVITGTGITGVSMEGVLSYRVLSVLRGKTYYSMGSFNNLASNLLRLKATGNKDIGDSWEFYNVMCFDLTAIYGEGNEPTTVEQFEVDYQRWFGKPLSYEEYDEGSLRSVKMSKIKTTGFNQWDEEWKRGYYDIYGNVYDDSPYIIRSINYTKILPNIEYYVKIPNTTIYFCEYDTNKKFLRRTKILESSNYCSFENDVAYIRFCIGTSAAQYPTYNHDICINISDTTKNGTYEPYEEHNVSLPVTTWKGRVGSDAPIVMFSDGLKRVSEALYDEIAFANGVKTAVKRVGSVDMGQLSWTYSDGIFTSSTISDIRFETLNCVCSRYVYYKSGITDKYFAISNNNIVVADSSYTDATTFRSAMAGVMLFFELNTSITYDLVEPDEFVWYGTKDGQEVKADTLPWYVSGQETSQLTVDAMYGESITAILRVRMPGQEDLSPSKAYASIAWRTQDNIDTRVVSENGGAVRSDMQDMTFSTIVNTNKTVLSDDIKQKHLAFNWKYRKSNAATEYNAGWGQNITLDADVLRNVKGSSSQLSSTLVYPYVYLIGAYEEVTDGGEIVMDTSAKVFDRAIE